MTSWWHRQAEINESNCALATAAGYILKLNTILYFQKAK